MPDASFIARILRRNHTRSYVRAFWLPDAAPWTWFAITGAYHLLGLVIVAVLVSVRR